MNAAAFFDDMRAFLRRGEIGEVASLDIWPTEPEIGAHVQVTCSGVDGVLRSSDGRQWRVADGSRIRLQLLADVTLWLCDDAGRIQVQETLRPRIDVPRLLDWNLPEPVSYAQPLRMQPRVSPGAQCALHWRLVGDQAWLPVPDVGLALPHHQAQIELRAVLSSRHAGLHPSATQEVTRVLQIEHPRPQWRLIAPPHIERHQHVELALATRWVRSASLHVGEGRVRRSARSPVHVERTTAAVLLPTADIGKVSAVITMEGVDGQVHEQVIELQVRPRAAACLLRQTQEGVCYDIQQAEPLRLELPTHQVDLPGAQGLIWHRFIHPVEGRIVYRDDSGAECHQPVVLQMPPPQWPDLPPIPPVHWAQP